MTRLFGFVLLFAWALPLQADIRLTVFDCGSISVADVSAFGISNSETDVRELFVHCYLISHPEGKLLWDAGLPLAMAGQPAQQDESGMTAMYERSLLDQLGDLDLSPKDIDLVAFSHFHFDHVGAANAFAGSRLLIQQTEYDAAFLNAADNTIFDPRLYDQLQHSPKTLLNGDYDVFGDGSVRIISAPGHTPGHQVLLLNLANTGKIMLSGDLYHFAVSRELRRTPVFNTNAAQTLESMDKIEALLTAEDATLWIEHNQALADTLRKALAYYD